MNKRNLQRAGVRYLKAALAKGAKITPHNWGVSGHGGIYTTCQIHGGICLLGSTLLGQKTGIGKHLKSRHGYNYHLRQDAAFVLGISYDEADALERGFSHGNPDDDYTPNEIKALEAGQAIRAELVRQKVVIFS